MTYLEKSDVEESADCDGDIGKEAIMFRYSLIIYQIISIELYYDMKHSKT